MKTHLSDPPVRRARLHPGLTALGLDEDDIGDLGPMFAEAPPHLRRRLRRLANEVTTLRHALSTAEARVAELERIADTDVLTPVANRRAFLRELERAVSFRDRHGMPSAMLFVDMNGLKTINDAHGHAAGDAVLLHVAQTLLASVRASDVVGRLGGDEFGVILFHTDAAHAQAKAEQISDVIRACPVVLDNMLLPVSAAIGACPLSVGEAPQAILARADKAMYACKRRAAA